MNPPESANSPVETYDCCVVGAGPVGLAFSLEAAETGARVLLVDAGDLRSGKRAPRLPPTRIMDPARHAPVELTVRHAIGGTTWLWGGRCVAFEPIDFEKRDFVPGSEWPIGYHDVAPWHAAAARYLDCGAPRFRSPEDGWPGLSEVAMSNQERWTRRPKLGPRLARRVREHPSITVLAHTRLTDLRFDERGGVAGIDVTREGVPSRIHARSYILAMGGLETTRLLLAVQRRRPHAFGGEGGPLGRYYMGHVTGSVAGIVLADPASAADLDFVRDAHDTYVRRRLTLTPEAQRRHRVLNTSFHLDNPAFYEHRHRKGTLSAVFLAIALPFLGRAVLAEGIRLRHIGPAPRRLAPHVMNVLRDPWRVLADVYDIVRRRYLSPVRKPGFLLRDREGRYALHYHGEQLPNPDSRITLDAEQGDSRALRIDFRYLDADIDSVLEAHRLLDHDLRAAGVGWLEYAAPTAQRLRELVWEQATDGFHSIGTTRMSAEPGEGVVDGDCRVHGVANLYIASSSVLPTSAEANPTFMAVALAVRLAHHLAAGDEAPGRDVVEALEQEMLAMQGQGGDILPPGTPAVRRLWGAPTRCRSEAAEKR